jgi:uncharacterized protein Yka (UPF0111/DUF47 family)
MTSWIKKYILPKEVDFLSALSSHAKIVKNIIDDLKNCFVSLEDRYCISILKDEHNAKLKRDKNMKELLNTFITPIDRESIYRIITQLDWLFVSVRHFVLEAKAYKIDKLDGDYIKMMDYLKLQSELLEAGFKTLRKDDIKTTQSAKRVRETYDDLVQIYIEKMAKLSLCNDPKEIFIHQSLLTQLKDISKRMRMTANSLEDIIMKLA